MQDNFFPERPVLSPRVYAFEYPHSTEHVGQIKVGYTTKDDVEVRIREINGTGNITWNTLLDEEAIDENGEYFDDHHIHRILRRSGIEHVNKEWYRCTIDDVRAAVLAAKQGKDFSLGRTLDFDMRPEQQAAVEKTAEYFTRARQEQPDKTPHFLWNAKMRFGKTFTSYQLAKQMGWKRILVLTFKPAVENAWEEDLRTHVDFDGWQFRSRNTLETNPVLDSTKPIVCFGSFQDYLGKN